MKKTLAALLLLISTSVSAGAYIDIGGSYVKELSITQELITNQQLVSQLTSTLSVDSWVVMLRLGYKFKSNMVVEMETFGTSEVHIERVNVFYRKEWN